LHLFGQAEITALLLPGYGFRVARRRAKRRPFTASVAGMRTVTHPADSADVSHGYTHTGREALEKAAAVFPAL